MLPSGLDQVEGVDHDSLRQRLDVSFEFANHTL